jgi:Ser/Thr protein kinase RdoA (MazF antagonist)
LLDAFGRTLGRLDTALADFDHPAVHRDFHWDLANASRVIDEHLPRDEDHRALVRRVRGSALDWIEPRRAAFRRSAIHNDANDWNVLVTSNPYTISVIDFGDMVHSWTVADPAVACAYALLDAENPLETAAAIVRGYHAEYPLRDEEIASVFPLATLRLCMSACIAAWQSQRRPNDEYLIVSQAPIRRTLPRLIEISMSVAGQTMRDACG